jgi:methylmalonyl-CoA/ethylmalonyl-CoA epimerase
MPEPSLHHFGYVVSSLPEALNGFAGSMGARVISEVIHDARQDVYVAFLQPPSQDSVQLELVAPASATSPVMAFAQKGGGLHHVCYEVDDLDETLAQARRRKCLPVRPPKPAAAFHGRRIAWIITPERLLIEYLEREKPSQVT